MTWGALARKVRMSIKGKLMPDISSSSLTRRVVIGAGAAMIAAGWLFWHQDKFEGRELTVQAAFEAAKTGDIILVDIRTPDEWVRTGIGVGANPIDMRRRDFTVALDALTGARKEIPVALICARGVRSARLSTELLDAGYTNVINVPEGMLGSRAGPGWIYAGLPVTDFDG